MTDVSADEASEPEGLSAADEQLLRELTERSRGGVALRGRSPRGARRAPRPRRLAAAVQRGGCGGR
jgi:hypothetical protein